MASTLRHGSHHHPLQHIGTMDASVRAANCRACDLPFTSENVDLFGCGLCGFFLHRSCCFMPTLLKNPAHPQHQLVLRYASAYSSGHFGCDICGNGGQGFNYHCQTCQFDAHLPCVNLPRKALSPAHQHRLQLLFRPPAMGRTSCGFCGIQIQHCCYSCSRCSFFLHPKCLKKQPRTGCSNNQQGPTKQSRLNLGNALMATSATVNLVRLGCQLFGGIDPAIDMDGWFGEEAGEDNDVEDGADIDDDGDFDDDMSTFGQPFGSGGYLDSALREEARSLAFEHMKRMGGGF
ncbi:uncharacterized protein LOC116261035 [Nymphaea colorata]|nr:uncharacterized protein LOC116261035 [Nymphaea colorata]